MLRSFLASTFASSKRCDTICWILTRKIFRFPNKLGLIINFQFGKILRQLPIHVFGVVPDDNNDPWYCPVKLMEDYVCFGTAIGGNMSLLYTKIDSACRQDVEWLFTSHLNVRFRYYLHRAGMDNCNQGDLKLSIHSLRAGSAITKLLEGKSLKRVMCYAYWKNPSTAWRYIKLLQVVLPFKDFGMDAISPEDYGILNSTPLTQQGKCSRHFRPMQTFLTSRNWIWCKQRHNPGLHGSMGRLGVVSVFAWIDPFSLSSPSRTPHPSNWKHTPFVLLHVL